MLLVPCVFFTSPRLNYNTISFLKIPKIIYCNLKISCGGKAINHYKQQQSITYTKITVVVTALNHRFGSIPSLSIARHLAAITIAEKFHFILGAHSKA